MPVAGSGSLEVGNEGLYFFFAAGASFDINYHRSPN